MFNIRKVTGSPSIPRKLKKKIKGKLQTQITARACSGTSDEWTDLHKTSGSTQEWDDVSEKCSEVYDYTSEDDYSPVEQLRCEEFSSCDYMSDHIVIPSSKSLLDVDSDDIEYLRNANPVAASTPQIFPGATLFEDETHQFGYFKHRSVKEATFILPEAPDITDDDNFQFNNPKASSTPFPEASLAKKDLEHLCHVKPLTGCRSVDLSNIATVSLPFETNFESDIEPTSDGGKNYPEDKESNCSMDATIVPEKNCFRSNSKPPNISSESEDDSILKLSIRDSRKECSISNVGIQSSNDVSGSVRENPEEMDSRTNSFFNRLKRSKTKLNNYQRKGTVTHTNLDNTKFQRLRDISNQDLKLPTRTSISSRNDSVLETKEQDKLLLSIKKKYKKSKELETKEKDNLLPSSKKKYKDVPIYKKGVQRTLKLMTPFYREDVPIDDLCFEQK